MENKDDQRVFSKHRMEKTVFISYRRANSAWALLIYKTLRSEGYDVFIDYTGIGSGAFNTAIVENIKSRAHFLVLLTPSSLENPSNSSKDWMRFEIQNAVDCRRNIVPVALEGFDFNDPSLVNKITCEFEQLKSYNALPVPAEYFDAAMTRLTDDFLSVELADVSHPPSPELTEIVTNSQAAADAAPDVTTQEVATSQKWMERGFAADKLDDRVQYFSEAIRLSPRYAFAYYMRGVSQASLGDHAAAIGDFDEAIRLDPKMARAFRNRGIAHSSLGDPLAAMNDFDDAIRYSFHSTRAKRDAYNDRGVLHANLGGHAAAVNDFDEAIRLGKKKLAISASGKIATAVFYSNRGNSRAELGDYVGAIKDYDEAIRLDPNLVRAYDGRGFLHARLGDHSVAIKDFDEAIRIDPEDRDAHYNRGLSYTALGDRTAAEEDYREAARLTRKLKH